jgi:hypothetical protein
MNINVFPEGAMTSGNMDYTQWTTSTTDVQIQAKLVTAMTTSDIFKVNSYEGKINEVAVDGAQALAASLVAAATVAATMF